MGAASCGALSDEPEGSEINQDLLPLPSAIASLPNNFPIPNSFGFSASYSTEGFVNLRNELNTPQGTNGRSCATCHLPGSGWGMTPLDGNLLFALTGGTHPVFNVLDANTPTSDVSTVEARHASYSMLRKGKFLRLRRPPANAEFEVIGASDPFNFGTTAQLLFFRRPPPTANFKSVTVMWDGANTQPTLQAGLFRQARSNITGAQQGPTPSDELVNTIVAQELALTNAQIYVFGAGRLDVDGAKGGPEAHASQPLVQGNFDLYSAWANSRKTKRAQIARGQEIFNNVNAASGRRCSGCHNVANSGQNFSGTLFDIGTSNPQFAQSDMAVYTLRNLTTGEIKETTDPGAGFVTGRWADLNRFKTPTLRGIAARAPYFHNGIAATLRDVVRFYEESLGFDFTPAEEEDLVAFMAAL
jgi:mono/diheme cytochrome c family protein